VIILEIFTERLKLKDVLPEKAKDIAKQYKLKEDDLEFIRKKTPLKAEDLKIEDDERAAIRYVNTADLDRDNEIVLPSGGQVDDFKKSPTVLYAHDYRSLPIGKDIWIKLIQGKGWLAKTVYAKHQLASDVYNLVKEKFLNTSSIGFIPLESVSPDKKGWDEVKDKVVADYGIAEKIVDNAKRIYTKLIMLEHSDVPIPANIGALNIAVGKGLEIKSKELIDDLELEIIDEEDEIELTDEGKKKLEAGLEDVKAGRVEKVDIDKMEKELEEEKEIVLKPEETTDYIRIPVRDCKVTATITISADEGIKALYCGKIKKIRTYLFAKAKGWDMKKAQAWVKKHGKEYDDIDIKDFEVEEDAETHQPEPEPTEKEEPNKSFSVDEIYKIIKENKELIIALEEMTVELKAGAVLNKKNKSDLSNAQQLIQNVLDSATTAEPAEEGKEVFNCECISCGYKMTSEKHCNTLTCPKCGGEMRRLERPGPGKEADELEIEEQTIDIDIKKDEKEAEPTEEKEETFDIDEKDLVEIIHSTLQEQLDKSAEKISKGLKEDISDNFKKMTGKVV